MKRRRRAMGPRPKKLSERFWPKVKRTSRGCWSWTGAKTKGGYGVLILTNGTHTTAHRVAWLVAFGPIRPGLYVLHRCDNPGCVNPDHLWIGTQKANILDMMAKGRHRTYDHRGEKSPSAKLTDAEVIRARQAVRRGRSLDSLAKALGVTKKTIRRAVTGKTFTHLR